MHTSWWWAHSFFFRRPGCDLNRKYQHPVHCFVQNQYQLIDPCPCIQSRSANMACPKRVLWKLVPGLSTFSGRKVGPQGPSVQGPTDQGPTFWGSICQGDVWWTHPSIIDLYVIKPRWPQASNINLCTCIWYQLIDPCIFSGSAKTACPRRCTTMWWTGCASPALHTAGYPPWTSVIILSLHPFFGSHQQIYFCHHSLLSWATPRQKAVSVFTYAPGALHLLSFHINVKLLALPRPPSAISFCVQCTHYFLMNVPTNLWAPYYIRCHLK